MLTCAVIASTRRGHDKIYRLTQGRWRRESIERRRHHEAEPRGREPSIGKSPELPRGRPGAKYDLRPAAGECEPHKRIKQKEDPSDFEHKHDPDRHWGPYALEVFRHETAHDMV